MEFLYLYFLKEPSIVTYLTNQDYLKGVLWQWSFRIHNAWGENGRSLLWGPRLHPQKRRSRVFDLAFRDAGSLTKKKTHLGAPFLLCVPYQWRFRYPGYPTFGIDSVRIWIKDYIIFDNQKEHNNNNDQNAPNTPTITKNKWGRSWHWPCEWLSVELCTTKTSLDLSWEKM